MAKTWVNRTIDYQPRNGTASNTFNFPPAASGSLLAVVIEGPTTHNTPAGWTKRTSATNLTEIALFTKTATAGESSATFTHAGSNYPIAAAIYEFASGSTYVGGSGATGLTTTGSAPSITVTADQDIVFGTFAAIADATTTVINNLTSLPSHMHLEAVTLQKYNSTSGFAFVQSYSRVNTVTSVVPAGTLSLDAGFISKEGLTWAINPADNGEPEILLRAAGTPTGATAAVTAVNPAVPTGTTTGDISVLAVVVKPDTATITTPSGWTLIGSNNTTGTGTRTALYVKESATVGAIGNITFGGSPVSAGAVIHSYKISNSGTWNYSEWAESPDATSAASISTNALTNMVLHQGDVVISAMGVMDDVALSGTQTFSIQAPSLSSAAGRSLDVADVLRTSHAVTTGTDCRLLYTDMHVETANTAGFLARPFFSQGMASAITASGLMLRLRPVKSGETRKPAIGSRNTTTNFNTASTAAPSASNITVTTNTGAATGDLSLIGVICKPYNTTIDTPSGWTKVSEVTNGTTAAGTDTGSVKTVLFARTWTGTPDASTVISFSGTAVDVAQASIISLQKNNGTSTATWDYSSFTTGTDSVNDANYLATGLTDLDVAAGDWVYAVTGINGDVGTPASTTLDGLIDSNEHGIFLNAVSSSVANATGTQSRNISIIQTLSDGTFTSSPKFSYTNASNSSGSTIFLRVRASTASTENYTGTAALTGVGTLTASGTVKTTAGLSGTGTLTNTPKVGFARSTSLSGTGTLTTATTISVSRTGVLSGTGTLTSVNRPSFAATVSLSGTGTLTAVAGAVERTGAASLSGTGTLSYAVSGLSISQNSPLTGSGTLTSGGVPSIGQIASLAGTGTLTYSVPFGISLRAAGTPTGTTDAVTAVNPAVPTGTTTGDLSVLTVSVKPYTATITTPTGWTKIGEHTNGTTASGVDTGSTKVALYVRESAPVGAIGAISQTSADSMSAVIHSYQKGSGEVWDFTAWTAGIDSSDGSNFSATGTQQLDVAAGDWIFAGTAVNSDTGTISGQVIDGLSGATLGTTQNRTNLDVTTGNDSALLTSDVPVTLGTSSATPTFTYTNASNTSGTTIWLRLRVRPAFTSPYVQSVQGTSFNTTRIQSIPATTSGNLLVLCVLHQATGTLTITDSAGQTWTKAGDTEDQGATSQYKVGIWYKTNSASVTTVTITNTATSTLAVSLSEWDLVAFNAVSVKYDATTGRTSGAASITANNGDVVIAATAYFKAENAAWPLDGYDELAAQGTSTTRMDVAWWQATSTGATNPGWQYPTVTTNNVGTISATFTGTEHYNTNGTLSGTGTLSAVANSISVSRAAAFSGTGSLGLQATISAVGSFAGTGTGTLSTSVIVGHKGSSALSGTGTLTATNSVPSITRSVPLTGTGTLSAAVSSLSITRSVALSGTGTLTCTQNSISTVQPASLSGTGILSGLAIGMSHSRSATLSGTGTLGYQAALSGSATAPLSGSGTLSAETVSAILQSAGLSGSGDLSSTTKLGFAANSELSGVGTLSVTRIPSAIVSVNLSGTGTLTATGTPKTLQNAGLTGSGTLTTGGTPHIVANAPLTGVGTLTANALLVGQSTTAELSGIGILNIQTDTSGSSTAFLSGTGVLSAQTLVGAVGSVGLSGEGTLSTDIEFRIDGATALSGDGTLLATGILNASNSVSLSGTGTLEPTGTGTVPEPEIAHLSGSGTLTASGIISQSGSGIMYGSGEGYLTVEDGTAGSSGIMFGLGEGFLNVAGMVVSSTIMFGSGEGFLSTVEISEPTVIAGTSGIGTLSAVASTLEVNGTAVLIGTGSLLVDGSAVAIDLAVLEGSGTLSALAVADTNPRNAAEVESIILPPDRGARIEESPYGVDIQRAIFNGVILDTNYERFNGKLVETNIWYFDILERE